MNVPPELAKTLGNGLLMCLICTQQVKAKIWVAHSNGKKHREGLIRLKASLNKQSEAKRSAPPFEDEPNKKRRRDEGESTSEELPSDFFESNNATPQNIPWEKKKKDHQEKLTVKQMFVRVHFRALFRPGMIENVPKGFFEDKRDARTEDTIKKNQQIDLEYERFIHEINTQDLNELNKEDQEETQELMERDIIEVEEQLKIWRNAHELEILVEAKAINPKYVKKTEAESESDDDIDASDIANLKSWRSREL